ncbi:MAG: hypothetical protein ACOC8F_05015 [Planctomycetota bacterium]
MQADPHTTPPGRRGIAALLSVFLLAVLTTLAVGMVAVSDMGARQSANWRRAVHARMAAESGLAYAVLLLGDCRSEPTLVELPDMLQAVHDYLAEQLPNNTVTLEPEAVAVPDVALPEGRACDLLIYVSQTDDDGKPTELQLEVTGRSGQLTRTVGMRFDVEVDRRLLHYACASSVRVIARGDVTINGPVQSAWGRQLIPIANDPDEHYRNHDVMPLDIDLGSDGWINGTMGTSLSHAEFTGDPARGDSDFHDGITSDNPNQPHLEHAVSYNEPDMTGLETQDFDTSPLKAMTSRDNLPAPDATDVSLGMWSLYGDKWQDHDGDTKAALHNVRIAPGTNPHFKNCTFTGITYIEVDEETDNPTSSNQNGVVFEDCIFEGPIVTGVPKRMRWDYNSMEFRGQTRFRTSMIQEALGGVTLMAPNYNVNIGGSEGGGGEGDSDVCGLVVGGVVDLYNDISVHGTVISMAEIVDEDGNIIMGKGTSWVTGSGVCGANIGNLNGSSDNVNLTPDPDNVIPLGVKRRYVVTPASHTYEELPG